MLPLRRLWWSLLLTCAAPVPAQLAVGTPAPTIAFTDQLNAPPGVRELADLHGAAILVEFWATWCGPCKAQIPHLRQIQQTYADRGLVVVAITEEPLAKVQPFAEQNGMDYPIAIAAGAMSAWKVQGIPHAFLIAPDGTIAWTGHPGALQNATIDKHIGGALSPLQRLTEQLAPVQDLLDRDQRGRALAMLEVLHKGGKLTDDASKRAAMVTTALHRQLASLVETTKSRDAFTAALALHELVHDWQGRAEAEAGGTRLGALAQAAKADVAAADLVLRARRLARRNELDPAEATWNEVLATEVDAAKVLATAGLAAISARRAAAATSVPRDR